MNEGKTESHPSRSAGRAPFPRTVRLTKAIEFNRVFEKNRSFGDDFFRVIVCPGEHHSRLGMAVSRKVDRRAAGRNRIKRVIRESFRSWAAGRQVKHGALDIVVLPRPRAAATCNETLFRSLERHWSRIDGMASNNGHGLKKSPGKND
jgi:ribonuclease P protein component